MPTGLFIQFDKVGTEGSSKKYGPVKEVFYHGTWLGVVPLNSEFEYIATLHICSPCFYRTSPSFGKLFGHEESMAINQMSYNRVRITHEEIPNL